jgi:tetratricopeptide (TPR) repeat protein
MSRARLSPLLALLLPLLAVPAASRAAAPAADPLDAEVEAVAREGLRLAGSPRGAAHLLRMHALKDVVADLAPMAATLERVARSPATHPLTRATAEHLLLDVERARGRLAEARALHQKLGHVHPFYVVGGFDNEGKAGCDRDFGPEGEALSLDARYPAAGREASWQPLVVDAQDGYVDLGAALRPAKEVVGYALTFLEAPADGQATLALGTSGGFRLWVNGQKVAASDRYNQPRPDQARVRVPVKKGLNRVLLKVCQEAGAFGFYLRQEAGPQAPALAARLPKEVPALPKGAASTRGTALPTLAEALAQEAKAAPRDAARVGEWATVLSATRAFDAAGRDDVVQAERAAQLAPKDVRLQLLAAQAHGEDHNERRRFLEAALAAGPRALLPRLLLAQHEESRGHPERALPLVEALAAEFPRSAPVRLTQLRVLEALGEGVQAEAALETALAALPDAPGLVRQGALLSWRRGRAEEARRRMRHALSLRHDDSATRMALANALADAGEVEAAVKELRAQVALEPFDLRARVRLGELLAANGKPQEGLEAFAAARALSPAEPDLHEREGRAQLFLERREEALASFERALELQPQNASLRETLRSLKGEGASAAERYALDVRPLLEEAGRYAQDDVVYVVDNTYVRVQPSGQASRFHQLALKVNTRRGVDQARSYPISYSPARESVRILRARITKPDGSVVEAYGEQDRMVNDASISMYYDARARVLSFPALAEGDLLELQYRVDDTAQENLLSDYFGDVESVQSTAVKVRYQYLVDMPQGRKLYWNEGEQAGVSHETQQSEPGRTLYAWRASRVPRVDPEPGMPGWAEVAGTLHVSTYADWEQVGRYYWGLVRDQLTPNEELRRTVDEVLVGVDRKDELAVVRALYNFVVTNTRYVALEFGIHGYKPYRVDRVLARRFGDCKDKASLIHALLKVAGVESKLVLLRMRNLGSLSGKPASLAAFNHAILYVPRHGLWLDGTAEFHNARELPSSDRTANVLVVEPDGKSTFSSIPEARAEDNLTDLTMRVRLLPDGSAELAGESQVAGLGAPENRRTYRAEATRRATFEQGWAQSFPGLTVRKVTINDTTRLDDDVRLAFDMAAPRFSEVLQGRVMRFHPFGTGRAYTQAFAALAERKHDLVLSHPWLQRFTYRFQLPEGYTLAELPPAVREQTPFGHLSMRFTREADGGLTAHGEVQLAVARVKAKDYGAFRAFLGKLDQAFARKLTLVPTAPGGTQVRR